MSDYFDATFGGLFGNLFQNAGTPLAREWARTAEMFERHGHAAEAAQARATAVALVGAES